MNNIVSKPWGYEKILVHNGKYAGKLIFIIHNCRTSYQYHKNKIESMYILQGEVSMELGDDKKVIKMVEGDSVDIPAGMKHRTAAITDTKIIEISTPELDDIVRLEDDYGRTQ